MQSHMFSYGDSGVITVQASSYNGAWLALLEKLDGVVVTTITVNTREIAYNGRSDVFYYDGVDAL